MVDTKELQRLMRRWASLPRHIQEFTIDAIRDADDFDSTDQVAVDLLEEAARVGSELEALEAQRIARDVRESELTSLQSDDRSI